MIDLWEVIVALNILGYPASGGGGGGGGAKSQLVFSSVDLNAKTAGVQSLFTLTSAAYNFIIPKSVIIVTTGLTGFTSVPQLTIGSNAAGGGTYDNLMGAGTDLSQLGVLGQVQSIDFSNSARIAVGTLMRMNITSVAVATTFSIRAILLGQGISA